MTAEQAWARRSELARDAAFQDRLRKGDGAARDELTKVAKGISSGMTFIGGPGVSLESLGQQAVEAAAAKQAFEREQNIDAIRKVADISDEVAQQVRERRPVTRAEKDRAAQRWNLLKKDQAWVTRLMSGDRAANTEKVLLDIIKASPLAD
jgi:hypothetical protein